MQGIGFTQPVSIFVGLGFPHDVGTPTEAYRILNEWTGSRGPTHAMALNVCRLAIAGEVDADTARLAFEAFARVRGILAPDAMVEVARRVSDEWLAA
ncbi:DUF982 domain-containing protein [Mesorhizobium sp. ASY16-5R]|uniref:DUF982 domain-containing protein n=1 Tax=Mesorhizobium sp. ASY16-5R TaxID=3445772 RepID=UPI003FA00252